MTNNSIASSPRYCWTRSWKWNSLSFTGMCFPLHKQRSTLTLEKIFRIITSHEWHNKLAASYRQSDWRTWDQVHQVHGREGFLYQCLRITMIPAKNHYNNKAEAGVKSDDNTLPTRRARKLRNWGMASSTAEMAGPCCAPLLESCK